MEDKELLKHIKDLGLGSISEYQKWCKHHGFGAGLNKSEQIRFKEKQYLKDLATKKALEASKEKHKPLGKKIKNILEAKDFSIQDISDNKIKSFFIAQEKNLQKKDYRDFLIFLQSIDKKSKLLQQSQERFIPEFGQSSNNTLFNALFLVFNFRDKMNKPLNSWDCNTKNLHRQFSSLLRHCFAKYKMPVFLDSAWFSTNSEELNWWFWIAEGNNIRKAPNLPIELTKKQAHCFLQSPENYTFTKALRHGQIMGISEDKRLVEAVLDTKLGRSFENDEFWFSVIQMFINNPMLDRNQLAPMIDYIEFIKFAPNAPHKGFSMKGRNPQTLIDEVEQWHSKISKERGKGYMEWHPSQIKGFSREEKIKDGHRQWTIMELTNSKLLSDEGRAMNHCVSSYKYSASQGRCSIWSLKCDGERLVTIEVNAQQNIVQARGKFNRLPEGKAVEMIRQWASEAGLNINTYGF
jgi:hypothetical protein